ncbi:MAG: hypothetical protein ACRYFX_10290 [Janthinobacterium lividum]
MRHFAKLHVAALEQRDNKLSDKLLASQMAHNRCVVQNSRNFGDEAVLHGAERTLVA